MFSQVENSSNRTKWANKVLSDHPPLQKTQKKKLANENEEKKNVINEPNGNYSTSQNRNSRQLESEGREN